VESLLSLALSDAPEALPAMLCLSTIDVARPLIAKCLDGALFSRHAVIALSQPNPQFPIISRLALLATAAFSACPELAIETCWFLDSLLPHVEESTVYGLFESLCADRARSISVQKWLIRYGLPVEIGRVLEETDYGTVGNYGDRELERVYACYRLVCISCMNGELAPSFQMLPMLTALSKGFVDPPDYVAGARWRAIRAVCTAKTVASMSALIAVAMATVVSVQAAPTQNLVGALRFVSHALCFSEECLRWVDVKHLFESVLGLLRQFANASILHNAVREFVMIVLRHRRLRNHLLEIFLPFILTEAVQRQHGCVAATCWELIDVLYTALNNGTLVSQVVSDSSEFAAIVRSRLFARRKKLAASYGGTTQQERTSK
jgi:hypothetical protein